MRALRVGFFVSIVSVLLGLAPLANSAAVTSGFMKMTLINETPVDFELSMQEGSMDDLSNMLESEDSSDTGALITLGDSESKKISAESQSEIQMDLVELEVLDSSKVTHFETSQGCVTEFKSASGAAVILSATTAQSLENYRCQISSDSNGALAITLAHAHF